MIAVFADIVKKAISIALVDESTTKMQNADDVVLISIKNIIHLISHSVVVIWYNLTVLVTIERYA